MKNLITLNFFIFERTNKLVSVQKRELTGRSRLEYRWNFNDLLHSFK